MLPQLQQLLLFRHPLWATSRLPCIGFVVYFSGLATDLVGRNEPLYQAWHPIALDLPPPVRHVKAKTTYTKRTQALQHPFDCSPRFMRSVVHQYHKAVPH